MNLYEVLETRFSEKPPKPVEFNHGSEKALKVEDQKAI
jgi:hypothetical protein